MLGGWVGGETSSHRGAQWPRDILESYLDTDSGSAMLVFWSDYHQNIQCPLPENEGSCKQCLVFVPHLWVLVGMSPQANARPD